MRKKIVIIAASLLLLSLLTCGIFGLCISSIPRELIEYNCSSSWGAESYSHMSAYIGADYGFNANEYDKTKVELASKYTVDSIETASALYSASLESSLSLYLPNSSESVRTCATVYLGDYFKFHPLKLVEGSYPQNGGAMTDSILIDELAAWQLFGTMRGLVGLEVTVGVDTYVISGVAAVPDGVYDEVYGELPRIYICSDSASLRAGTDTRTFTCCDAMLPDPITNYAKNTLEDVLGSYDAVIVNNDTSFSSETLKETYESQTKLVTDPDKVEYPYTEKARMILSLRAADLYNVESIVIKVAILSAAVLFFALFGPVVKFIERMLAKLKF